MSNKAIITNGTDVLEDNLLDLSPCVLKELLKDQSASLAKKDNKEQTNIFWATDNYELKYGQGCGFDFNDPITIEKITGKNGQVIQPRVDKSREEQLKRSRDKAEVFTPAWICNKQINLIDAAWFGRGQVFNIEIDHTDGTHEWQATEGKILFPKSPKKSWKRYITEPRLEITCGEAPYLASRYDMNTGRLIPLPMRIGMLDRKMRIINERCKEKAEWLAYTKLAYQSIYGYDWQGDNVLIARETLLYTFIENYNELFDEIPTPEMLLSIAQIVSWNIWQMDGFKYVVPNSCHEERIPSLFPDKVEIRQCPGCSQNRHDLHNGIPCLVMDWEKNETIEFYKLFS